MTEHAVVIAGGGPTGLMLAGELALAGIDVVIVERRASQDLDGIARRRSSLPHHRGARSAWHRGTVPRGGAGHADPGLRPDPVGHQRLPHPPQLRACALAEPLRAHPGRLGRRARGADPSWPRGGRASRRTTPASTSSCPTARSLRAEYLVGCDGGRSLIRKAAGIDFPGWDPSTSWMIAEVEMERAAGVRPAPRGWRHRSRRSEDRRGAVRGRAEGTSTSTTPASPPCSDLREALVAAVRDRLRGAQPDLDLPVHRHDAPGRLVSPGPGAARR